MWLCELYTGVVVRPRPDLDDNINITTRDFSPLPALLPPNRHKDIDDAPDQVPTERYAFRPRL